jgi:hypothetical protein
MPQRISTPEEWFRTQACDFFAIGLAKGVKEVPAELKEWFKQHLPHRSLTPIGPSEHSGWICGGPVMYQVAMDENDLKAFCERWEDRSGKSLDPRWQCYQCCYWDWLVKFDRIQTMAGVPPAGTTCRWLLCNAGVFWLTGSYTKEDGDYSELCFDDWWIIRQRFPDLSIGADEVFLMGYTIFRNPDALPLVAVEEYEEKDGDVHYAHGFRTALEKEAINRRIRTELALPENTEIGHEIC